jgi:hypothetical protein
MEYEEFIKRAREIGQSEKFAKMSWEAYNESLSYLKKKQPNDAKDPDKIRQVAEIFLDPPPIVDYFQSDENTLGGDK